MDNFCDNFSVALAMLKDGKKIARKGWNGKDMYLVYMPGYQDIEPNAATVEAHGLTYGDKITIRPYIAMRDAQGCIVSGWLASQADLLADDWGTV